MPGSFWQDVWRTSQRRGPSDDHEANTNAISWNNYNCYWMLSSIPFIVAAVGCSDLSPPSDAAWLKRVGDQITVGCYMSRQSWQLNCVDGVWTGTVGVCTDTYSNEGQGIFIQKNELNLKLKLVKYQGYYESRYLGKYNKIIYVFGTERCWDMCYKRNRFVFLWVSVFCGFCLTL